MTIPKSSRTGSTSSDLVSYPGWLILTPSAEMQSMYSRIPAESICDHDSDWIISVTWPKWGVSLSLEFRNELITCRGTFEWNGCVPTVLSFAVKMDIIK